MTHLVAESTLQMITRALPHLKAQSRLVQCVCLCEFDSLRGRYSFVALIVKLHLESRYKVTFLELSFIEWNALDSNEPTV